MIMIFNKVFVLTSVLFAVDIIENINNTRDGIIKLNAVVGGGGGIVIPDAGISAYWLN